MTLQITQFLFAAIRSTVTEQPLTAEERALFSKEDLPQYHEISYKHDVAHLIAYAIQQNALLENPNPAIHNTVMQAIYRCEQQTHELLQLSELFENEGIDFLPLKGSVLRRYYRESWMRTSCDIDILIKENDLDRAKTLLIEKLSYQYDTKGGHDISFFSPTNIHIELHYDLVEEGRAKNAATVLKGIWGKVSLREGFSHRFEMPDELYYFYHIAHMAKHFEDGGCGIRPLIDLWILDNLKHANTEERIRLLEEGELLQFAKASQNLSRIWFEHEPYHPVVKQMEDYILRGGVYGNTENHIIVHQQKKGGRIKYALSKIFLPYKVIKYHYPILEKHRWLTPFMQVRRWCKLIFCGHLRRAAKELQYNNRISNAEATDMQIFLKTIGL